MLAGKKALVTGASSGIGLEMARQLAAAGADVAIVSRNQEELNEIGKLIAEKYGVKVQAIAQDLSAVDAAQTLVDKLNLEGWKIDILVNNAGFGAIGSFADLDLDMQTDMMFVNMVALTQLTGLLLPYMMDKHWGRIMNVASMAAFEPGPYMSLYFATKAFVYSFSSALHEELINSGVTVTALCPGATATNFGLRAGYNHKVRGADPGKVAAAGLRGMFRRQRLVVPGVANNVMLFLERFVPTTFVVKILSYLQSQRKL